MRTDQLRRMLAYMLDENEFLSPYGVRSVSRYHLKHPLVMQLDGQEYRLDYEPGESTTDLFGGNSNWRGPIWMPVNFLIIQALREYHLYYGNSFQVECPTGSGQNDDAGASGQGIGAAAGAHFPSRATTESGPCSATARCSTTTRIGAITFRFTSIFTAIRAAAAGPAIKRAGQG